MAERKRIAVPISGIDTSTPDHSVTDGKCATLNNLRYTGNAWRNVKEFEKVINSWSITNQGLYNNFNIVYKHPADDDNAYICTAQYDGQIPGKRLVRVARSADANGEITYTISAITYLSDNLYHFSHFGKILVVGNSTTNTFTYYLLQGDSYTAFNVQNMQGELSYDLGGSIVSTAMTVGNPAGTYQYVKEIIYSNAASEVVFSSVQGNRWRGEVAILLTIEDPDGGELYRSAPILINTAQQTVDSFTGNYGWIQAMERLQTAYPERKPIFTLESFNTGYAHTVNVVADALDWWYNNNTGQAELDARLDIVNNGLPYMRFYRPTVTATLNEDIVKTASKGRLMLVKIWTTRIYPMFDIEKLKAASAEGEAYIQTINTCNYFADNNIFNEPFYLYETLNMSAFEESETTGIYTKSIDIDAIKLQNVIHNTVYEAKIGYSNVYSDKILEYNNRWHLSSVWQRFNSQQDLNLQTSDTETAYRRIVLVQQVDGESFTNIGSSLPTLATYYKETQPMLITAPLYTKYLLFCLGNSVMASFPMDTSTALAISIYINKSSHALRDSENYSIATKPYADTVLWRDDFGYHSSTDLSTKKFIDGLQESNRIIVSSANSNFTFSYDQSYRVGSSDNEIITANSAAIEMSDAKFGEFPLYVFTKEGIFAMQSGKETLYSAIVPINYDVIINPNTLAVNGAVLYFTDKGLHALTNQGAKLLSQPIHTEENRIPDWMYTCQMVYLPEWNEVLCTDLPSKKAYVFSLDNNVWSTRDIPEGYILNNDELVARDSIIYDVRNEEESLSSEMPFTLSTRPIKLGSMELKRAETIIVRFECDTEQTLLVEVEGSIDTQNWHVLRELDGVHTNKDILIRRTPCSVKYLRFIIRGEVTDDIRILAFEVEYYNRMRHRMR